jgi:carboxymethylenebutenolidase
MASTDVYVQSADGGRFAAYLAMPPAVTRTPGVVVLQEIFGVNANIRAIVDAFAAAGFIAIAPDVFWRQQAGVNLDPGRAEDRERAMGLMKGLDERLAIEDAAAAMAYVRGLPQSNGRVGAVGYCLGGKLAYLMAARTNVDAAVSYYGVQIQASLDEAARVRAPLLLHVAAEDTLCPPETQAAIAAAMAPLHDRVSIRTYPGVGHAFARRGGASFDEAAAAQADSATLGFLGALRTA